MPSDNALRLEFSGSMDMLTIVDSVSQQLCRDAGLDDESQYWTRLAIREAVINAIKHGNGVNDPRPVVVEFVPIEEPSGGVMVRVRDHGKGFDPEAVPDPLASENMLKGSGRGLLMIRTFVDELVFRRMAEGGMEVTIVKRPAV
jgi:serine/threonine-protein kinase RsbW